MKDLLRTALLLLVASLATAMVARTQVNLGIWTLTGTEEEDSSRIAYSSVDHRMMVVCQRELAIGEGVYAYIRNDDGVAVSGPFLVASFGNPQNPTVVATHAFGQRCFCVFFERFNLIEARLYSTSGVALTSAIDVTSPVAGEVHRRPSATGMADSGVLLAWDSTPPGAANPTEIQTRLLEFESGGISTGQVRVLQSVTSGGYVQRVRLAKSHAVLTASALTWQGTRAVWERFYTSPAPGDFDVWTASFRITQQGAGAFVFIDPPGSVAGAQTIAVDEQLPDIAMYAARGVDPTDERFMIAFEDGDDVRGAVYDFDGLVTGSILLADGGFDPAGQPSVAATGCEFAVAYKTSTLIWCKRLQVDGAVKSGRVFAWGAAGTRRPMLIGGQLQPVAPVASARAGFTVSGTHLPTGQDRVYFALYEPFEFAPQFWGSGCAGSGSSVPQIGTSGTGLLGNLSFAVTASSAPPNTLAVLMGGQGFPSPIAVPGAPGCELYIEAPIPVSIATVTDGNGLASVPVPLPCMLGSTSSVPGFLNVQWAFLDPSANALGWIASRRMSLQWDI